MFTRNYTYKLYLTQNGKKDLKSIIADSNVKQSLQEEEDLARAIQLSLQDTKTSASQQVSKNTFYSRVIIVGVIIL